MLVVLPPAVGIELCPEKSDVERKKSAEKSVDVYLGIEGSVIKSVVA